MFAFNPSRLCFAIAFADASTSRCPTVAIFPPICASAAYTSFVDQGYLARSGGKLGLTPSYATQRAVATIEARIAAMGATLAG